MDALEFATPSLQTGRVIYYDDWYVSGGDLRLGEAGAHYDWLARHPEIKAIDFGDVAIMGKLFIINLSRSA